MKIKMTSQNSKLLNFTFWFFLFTFSFLLLNVSCDQREAGPGEGTRAPDFTLQDIDRENVTLSEVTAANEATLVVFWTTWCPSCRREAPELNRLNAEYKNRGLKILAVNLNESGAAVARFMKDAGVQYPVLLDPDGKAGNAYGITTIPNNILIGRDGVIKYRGNALPPKELLP